MNFLFTINEVYAKPIETLLFSIYDNLGPGNRFYFIYSDIADNSVYELTSFIKSKCQGVAIFIRFPYDDIVGHLPIEGSWSKENYYRLFAPYILTDLEQIIYLDGDTLVTGKLEMLKALEDDRSFVVAAAKNDSQRNHLIRLGLDAQGIYVNAGVLVINLKQWRESCSFDEMVACLDHLKDKLQFHDQDFINLIWQDKIKVLPRSYNYMISLTERDKSYTKISNPEICHYVFTKPWFDYFEYGTDGPYIYYLKKSGKKKEGTRLHRKHRIVRLKIIIKRFFQRSICAGVL